MVEPRRVLLSSRAEIPPKSVELSICAAANFVGGVLLLVWFAFFTDAMRAASGRLAAFRQFFGMGGHESACSTVHDGDQDSAFQLAGFRQEFE
ncbi:hypothetical protein [Caballeronia hypogeia]|uniref:hypothetical protein n=1 Tax=Caballeronia hypogeia TaxID=1777140 RepID=UPI0012FDA1E3|nr:hypothetical protein [Caballeronia hypogeia]